MCEIHKVIKYWPMRINYSIVFNPFPTRWTQRGLEVTQLVLNETPAMPSAGILQPLLGALLSLSLSLLLL